MSVDEGILDTPRLSGYKEGIGELQKAQESRKKDRIGRIAIGVILSVGSFLGAGFIGAVFGGFIAAPIVNMLSESQNYSKILRIGLIAGGIISATIAGGIAVIFSTVQYIIGEKIRKEIWMRKLRAYTGILRISEENSENMRAAYGPRAFAFRLEKYCQGASLQEIQLACETVLKILDVQNKNHIINLCSQLTKIEDDGDFFYKGLEYVRSCYDNRDKNEQECYL